MGHGQDSGCWGELVQLIQQGETQRVWERYRRYLQANNIISRRRKILADMIDITISELALLAECRRLLVEVIDEYPIGLSVEWFEAAKQVAGGGDGD